MKVLVIGSGGREHALCWKLAQSKKVSKIYCAPGNGGTSLLAVNVDILANDIDGLLNFALEKKIDLTIVGPEEPLVLGIVDRFQKHNLKIFGPNKEAAKLEGSKEFSKNFMNKHKIKTAQYQTASNYDEAIEIIKEFNFPLVIKADGLCAGKGVYITQTEKEALIALKEIMLDNKFGSEGRKVIIEEYLEGIEASLLCFVDGNKLIPMQSAKDYKKIGDNDQGLNTGGVGCYSPSPLFTSDLKELVEKEILNKVMTGLKNEKLDFKGILFIGLMIVNNFPYVLEFNVRFGDPEIEVLLPRLESDLVDIIENILNGNLKESDIKWQSNHALAVVLTSGGYPEEYQVGYQITGVDKLDKDIILFHNGTKYQDGVLKTSGGRVLTITALGKTIEEAREKVYENIEKIKFKEVKYRSDIGK